MVMEIPENCVDVQNALHLYVGDDLEPEVLRAVARHLDGCAGCRALAEDASAARDAFRSLGDRTPPAPPVWAAVRSELVREGLVAGAPVARRSSWWIVPAAAAASVAAVLVTLALRGDPAVTPQDRVQPIAGPRPVALQPVQPGSRSLVEESPSFGAPVFGSVPDAAPAGQRTSVRPIPTDPREIVR